MIVPDSTRSNAGDRPPTPDPDRLTPPDCSQEIANLVPGAELVWVPDCGHMLTMEKPALVNASLGAWLERLVA